MDSQTFKPDLRRLLATQLHKPLSTWSHQCTLETHSETFTHSCSSGHSRSHPQTQAHTQGHSHTPVRSGHSRSHPQTQAHTQRHSHTHPCVTISTPSDNFIQAPVDNIHMYKGKHKGTHLHTQVHSQRHKKERTQAQGYSGTLRGICALCTGAHQDTLSDTHSCTFEYVLTVKTTHLYAHACRTLEHSRMFGQV